MSAISLKLAPLPILTFGVRWRLRMFTHASWDAITRVAASPSTRGRGAAGVDGGGLIASEPLSAPVVQKCAEEALWTIGALKPAGLQACAAHSAEIVRLREAVRVAEVRLRQLENELDGQGFPAHANRTSNGSAGALAERRVRITARALRAAASDLESRREELAAALSARLAVAESVAASAETAQGAAHTAIAVYWAWRLRLCRGPKPEPVYPCIVLPDWVLDPTLLFAGQPPTSPSSSIPSEVQS